MGYELIAAAVAYLAGRGTTFLDAVMKPTATALGEDLLGRYRSWRGRNVAAVVDAADNMLNAVGQKPAPVPGRILFPLLDYCSLEEDEDLQKRWAALLANAASSSDTNKVLPAFAEILRQLTPVQARILQWMYQMKCQPVSGWIDTWPDVPRGDVESVFNLSHADYALLVTDFERLNLIEPRRDIIAGAVGTELPMDHMLQLVVDRWNSRVKYESIGFTTLGLRFIQACTPPKISSPESD